MKKKLFRVAASSASLAVLLKGQLRFMSDHFEVKGIASEGMQHDNIKKNEGVETIVVRIERKINLWADFKTLYELYTIFRREKPFIVHSITPKAGLLSMMAAYFAGVPHRLHTFTGLIFPTKKGLMKSMLIFFDKVICRCATNIYPEGNGVKNDLERYGITNKPLKVIANGNVNGIDLTHFDPALYNEGKRTEIRKELGIADSDFLLSFIGRIVSDKGIEEMINAFSRIRESHTDVKLLLVGPFEKKLDPIPDYIKKEIDENPHILKIGFQHDVRPFFAITDVFVFPSYREGFPNVVLQAGAMGRFSIVTDINGSNEIIEEGLNGTIIPVKNEEALVEALSNTIENREDHRDPDERFRALIASKYNQQVVWDAQLEEYNQLGEN